MRVEGSGKDEEVGSWKDVEGGYERMEGLGMRNKGREKKG